MEVAKSLIHAMLSENQELLDEAEAMEGVEAVEGAEADAAGELAERPSQPAQPEGRSTRWGMSGPLPLMAIAVSAPKRCTTETQAYLRLFTQSLPELLPS